MGLAWGLLFLALASRAPAEGGGLRDPLDILLSMREGYRSINGYSAIMEKSEPAVSKKSGVETIFIKFQKPYKLYMKWVEEPHKGREIIYVAGENDDCFLAKPDGFLGYVVKAIKKPGTHKSPETRYSMQEVGIGSLIDSIVDTTLQARDNNELRLFYRGTAKRSGREAYVVERLLPARDSYPNSRLVVYVDTATRLPLEAYAYGADGTLWEHCKYREVRINPELKDIDFSTENREYGFNYF
jgi:hypothetical protein